MQHQSLKFFAGEIDAAMKQCEDDVDFSADWLAVAAALTSVTTSGGEPESEPFTTGNINCLHC